MDKIIDIRFVAPVGIFLLFLCGPFYENLLQTKVYFSAESLIGGTVMILGIGFMLSTLAHTIIGLIEGPVGEYPHDFTKFYKLKDGQIKEFSKEKIISAGELAAWIILNKEENSKNISDQIHKRWNMAEANFNAAIAVFLGTVFTIIIMWIDVESRLISCFWFVVYLIVAMVFCALFICNGRKARRSVLDMDDLLAEKNKEITL